MIKILFLSHNASNTGAPILLIRLIEELKEKIQFQPIILLQHGGILKERFQALGKVFEWNPDICESQFEILKFKLLRRLRINANNKLEKHRLKIVDLISDVDCIVNNTIANGSVLAKLNLSNKKVLSYLHELTIGIQIDSSPLNMKILHEKSNKIFVPSLAVKDCLIEEYHFDASKLEVLKSLMPLPKADNELYNQNGTYIENLPTSSFIVSFCGTLDWRKGCDLVPLIVKKTFQQFPDSLIHFLWIGADLGSKEFLVVKSDLAKLKLSDKVTFIERQDDIQMYLKRTNILLLPSREDAFPLVVLEAAQYNVPCIYFSNAGGISEFCGTEAGIAIDYLDLDKMVEKVGLLATNPLLFQELGKSAKSKIQSYAFEAKKLQPILDFINK